MSNWRMLAAAAALALAGPGWAQRPVAGNVASEPAAAATEVASATGEEAGRIINGRDAKPGELPFQVQLFFLEPDPAKPGAPPVPDWQRAHRCGGALIAPEWVLTAAHCFFDGRNKRPDEKTLSLYRADWFGVRAGSLKITDAARDGVEVPVAAIYVHPGYVPCKDCPPFQQAAGSPALARQFTHDLALVQLKRPMPTSATVRPVPLFVPERDRALTPGRPVAASGWGLASNAAATEMAVLQTTREQAGNSAIRAQPEPILQVAALETVPCTGEGELPTHFCAGGRDGADTCMGDSGGPLVMQRPGGTVLVGITSRRPFGERLCGGSTGARAKVETRYSRVDADHAKWIAQTMGSTP
jgi:hypothetical protein